AFDLLGRNAKKTAAYMQEFATKGKVSLSKYGVSVKKLRKLGFESGSSTHANRLETIKHVYETSRVVIDPHTADGIYIARKLKDKKVPILCMATALPVKFENTIKEALGFVPFRPKHFANIERKSASGNFTVLGFDANALKSFIRKNA